MQLTNGREHKRALLADNMDKMLVSIPREQRIQLVEEMICTYLNTYERKPPHRELELLADLLLHEELSDSDPYKVAHNEYPILSLTQLKRRMYGRGKASATNMKGEAGLLETILSD